MKRILMIGTGGTIASQISGNALSPQLRPDELLALVPAISKLCEVEHDSGALGADNKVCAR